MALDNGGGDVGEVVLGPGYGGDPGARRRGGLPAGKRVGSIRRKRGQREELTGFWAFLWKAQEGDIVLRHSDHRRRRRRRDPREPSAGDTSEQSSPASVPASQHVWLELRSRERAWGLKDSSLDRRALHFIKIGYFDI